MTTMAQAIKTFLEARGAPASSQEIRRHIEAEYAGQWQPRTLQAHLYACAVNNPKAYVHHPFAERFLYKTGTVRSSCIPSSCTGRTSGRRPRVRTKCKLWRKWSRRRSV